MSDYNNERGAWVRYEEALARGLSDHEAREEGWPMSEFLGVQEYVRQMKQAGVSAYTILAEVSKIYEMNSKSL